MEQKRIKLENPTPPTKSSSASTYDPRQIIDALGLFRSKPQKAQAELLRLKKHLDSKERVLAFLEYDNKSAYRALLSHIIGLADNFFVAPYEVDLARQQIVTILRELCSVVANLCHFSVLACIETCLHFDDLCRVFIQVLQDVNQTEEHLLSTLRCPVLRLIGNLCEVKEAATYVALRARLLDLVASSVARPQPSAGEGAADDDEDKAPLEQRQEQGLNSNDEHYYALRVLRLLATRRKHSNAPKHRTHDYAASR